MSRIGACFEGGGAQAVWGLGRMHALGLKPDIMAGTSGGALVAGVSSYLTPDETRDWFFSIKDLGELFKWDWFKINGGLASSKPLLKKLHELLANKVPHTQCAVTTVDLDTYDLLFKDNDYKLMSLFIVSKEVNELLNYEDFYPWIVASMSVPSIVAPYLGRYIDGGVREGVPIDYLVKAGCDEIHVMLARPYPRQPPAPLKGIKNNALSVLARTVDILLWERSKQDMKDIEECRARHPHITFHIHAPKIQHVQMHDYNTDALKRVYWAGFNNL